ncbi:ribulose-phosphate 3-epimerase [Lederbergia galactosidilytica]|uniref:Ribulose-phosphate 3-epimerase n=1 Tax=Lederbergia galactosidilytica TaxID=217031 RepID=A0A177ZGU7_9BACI|nr:ribulose-phosphate 3-epimerase [Lederbergia galactosidilytica]KRG15361.1 ribulose-phosphate 3-epimerase [Virgibacillus soli]MBP1915794.1 ribulose-phosphate 3-epimerase [Lederbergia galactosidilytica]OAK67181.1 ribulose-phosphate 3-epimerase [Lederbergia galactosidilytica]
MYKLGPSLMCADLGNLEQNMKELDKAGVDFYHIDIMDGKFVPNFTLGPDFVKTVRKLTDTPIDVHLMIEEPERHIDLFVDCGVEMISVHQESTQNLHSLLSRIKNHGIKAGVAINPGTSLEFLDNVYDLLDYIVIMTVNPGFAGQKFIPTMYRKIAKVSEIIKKYNRNIEIQVDGNIGANTIPKCEENGATMYVLGTSAIFNSHHTLEENVALTRKLFNHETK